MRVFKSKAQVKKPEFQQLCECAQFLQGRCWGDAGVIKIAGQGLGASVVAKIKTSVQSEIGVHYDIELATEEESASRELEGEEHGQETPVSEAPKQTGPMDAAASYNAALAKLSDDLKAALHLGGPAVAEIKQQFAQANAYAQQKDYTAALLQLVQLNRRIADALAAGSGSTVPSGAPDLGLWTTARNNAVKQVRHVQSELLKTHDPECIQAAKMLEAVPSKLNVPLDSLESAESLEQFVGDNELIALMDQEKFFGVTTDVRNSLLSTLEIVKKQFAS